MSQQYNGLGIFAKAVVLKHLIMLTMTITLFFLGFFLLSLTSKRNGSNKPLFLENIIKGDSVVLKIMGTIILISAFVLLGIFEGFGTGVFLGFVFLMVIASLVVLLNPLKLIGYRGMFLVFICLLILELTL